MKGTPDLERGTGESEAQEFPPLLVQSIRESLEKVLSSRTFHAAEGQRVFLRFVVDQALAGNGHLLKEYVIATEGLGRDESFDPRLDPIVRTQARKLRTRLDKYYASEGSADCVRIDFPKGSYVPSFREVDFTAAAELVDTGVVASSTEIQKTVPESPVAELPLIHSQSRWSLAPVSLAVLLALISGATASYLLHSLMAERLIPPDGASLAVLPFVNLGDIQADEFLSDGLTDELIESLRTVKGLQVVAHTSAFQFKGNSTNVKEIGQKLHVRTILVGSVRRLKNRLQVTAQLNSVPNGYHLWTGNYDREASDARAIEVEISKAVANVLGMALAHPPDGGRELVAMLSRRPLPNPNSHESYLRGLFHWNKLTERDLNFARSYFEEAIAEDPSFARAYAALADCYVMAPQVGTTPPLAVAGRIKDFATKAVALDEFLGEAHIDLAISAEYEFDWNRADREFKKGLALSPGNMVGHLWYAKYLAMVGRKPEVLTQRKLAADLDPVSAYALQSVAGYFSITGHYDSAISQFKSALALEPNFGLAHQGLGVTYLWAGRHSEALDELQLAQKVIGGPRRLALLGYAYAVAGRTQDARRILDILLQQARDDSFPALAVADVYIGLGDKDRAFAWLQKAIDQRDLNLDLKWDMIFNPVRDDARYVSLLRRMKLV